MSRRALVAGAGFAGLGAALELAKRGWKVTLIEKSPRLGGRAGSFHHARLGLELDGGQHLLLGAYTETVKLLEEIGEEKGIRWQPRLEVPFFSSKGTFVLKSRPLPGPLGLGMGLLNFGLLTGREKWEALRCGFYAWRGLWNPASLRGQTAAQWLAKSGQSEGLIRKFWEPLCIAAVNAPSSEAPAELLAVSMRQGFLRGGRTSALGFPLKPFSQLLEPSYINRAQALGMEVRLSTGLASLTAGKGGVQAVLENGETVEADACVLALPSNLLAKVLDPALVEKLGLKEAAKLDASPILTAHLFSEEPFLPGPFGVFAPEGGDLGFEFHWCFDRKVLFGQDGPEGLRWSTLVASAARRLAGRKQEDILLELKRQLARRLGKGFDPSKIRQALVLKEARATPLFPPDFERPAQATKIPRLALAGDWTDTGLPATIEGALVSGLRAARHLEDSL